MTLIQGQEAVLLVLAADVRRRGGIRPASRVYGVNHGNLHRMMHGQKPIAAKVLKRLGYRQVVRYELR